jgi:hypothetical protein
MDRTELSLDRICGILERQADSSKKISLTIQVYPHDAIWLSKLLAILNESRYGIMADDTPDKTIEEIKKIINDFEL